MPPARAAPTPGRAACAAMVAAIARRSSPAGSPRAHCRAGRQDALPSPRRPAGKRSPPIGLPREESRGLAENLPLLPEPDHLPAQLHELLPLLRRQPLTLAGIDLRLLDPGAQRLLRHTQLSRDLRHPPAADLDQPDRLRPELRRIRGTCTRHLDSFPRACTRKRQGVNQIGSTPTPRSTTRSRLATRRSTR